MKFTRFPARIKAKTLSSVMSSLFQANANIKIILINCNFVPDFGRFPEQPPGIRRFVPVSALFSEQTDARLSGPMAEQLRPFGVPEVLSVTCLLF